MSSTHEMGGGAAWERNETGGHHVPGQGCGLPPPNQPFRSGFTLIELLVVIAIILILAVIVTPAFRGITAGNSLTTGGTFLVSEFDLARQSAITEGTQIELRFYKLPDVGGQNAAYRAFQRVRSYDQRPLGRVHHLPPGIILLENQKFSTLLSTENTLSGTNDLPSAASVPFKGVAFKSGGGTTLNPEGTSGGDGWFVSLKPENSAQESDRPAKNYLTVQVDPISGRTKVFRP